MAGNEPITEVHLQLAEERVKTAISENETKSRAVSDKRYAEMRVQIIVYGACALILIAFITGMTALWVNSQ
jgi:type VI protein secretion system component VasF